MSAMPPDHETQLRQTYDLLNEERFDEAVQAASEEFVLHTVGPARPVRGPAELRRFLEPQALMDQRYEVLEIRIDGATALVWVAVRAVGVSSGLEVAHEWGHVWRFAGDEATSLHVLADRVSALEEAGFDPP
jgi:hypothetical protein